MIPHSKPTLGEEEKKACLAVLDSLQIAQGEKVAAFEKAFCELIPRRFAVAVSSGTSALHLSLLALGIRPRDEVIVPSFTCAALLHALQAVGASPVVVDIDLEDGNISVVEVKKKLSRKTKAVIVPHVFGRAAKIHELIRLGVPVIEDGTQALGARAGSKNVGAFGAISVFSFYATKMITTGEGGMILTGSRELARKLLDLRDYDKKSDYRFRTNSKMTDLEAAIGIEQLKKLPFFIQRRSEIAFHYTQALKETSVIVPVKDDHRDHVYFRYAVRVPKKSGVWLKQLQGQGIDAKRPVFKPLHRYLGLSDKLFPWTTQAMKETCSLPIFPSLSSEDCAAVCAALQAQGHSSLRRGALALNR